MRIAVIERCGVTPHHEFPPPSSAIILIVDDQKQNLQVVGTVLSMTGYEVITAGSGAQTFERLEERIPDVILLDL